MAVTPPPAKNLLKIIIFLIKVTAIINNQENADAINTFIQTATTTTNSNDAIDNEKNGNKIMNSNDGTDDEKMVIK